MTLCFSYKRTERTAKLRSIVGATLAVAPGWGRAGLPAGVRLARPRPAPVRPAMGDYIPKGPLCLIPYLTSCID